MTPHEQSRPRRSQRRQSELSLDLAREILKLLASASPAGLTVLEIILHVRSPAAEAIRTLALMQCRQLLRTNPQGVFSIDPRMPELSEFS